MATIVPPERFLIHYGWPSAINSGSPPSQNVPNAILEYDNYTRAVLPDQVWQPTHGDHLQTKQIIAGSSCEFWGYVPLGQLSWNQQLTQAQVQTAVNGWVAMGSNVVGIFFDEFGYDYGVTRAFQNTCVGIAHTAGLNAWANAWDPNHAMDSLNTTGQAGYPNAGLNSVGGGNPGGAAPTLVNDTTYTDRYLYESFQVMNGSYPSRAAWRAKVASCITGKTATGVKIDCISTDVPVTLPVVFPLASNWSETNWEYVYYSAMIDEFDGAAWGHPNFGATDDMNPWRETPNTDNTGAWAGAISVGTTSATRTDDNANVCTITLSNTSRDGDWGLP